MASLDPCTGIRVSLDVQTRPQLRRRTRREISSELDRPSTTDRGGKRHSGVISQPSPLYLIRTRHRSGANPAPAAGGWHPLRSWADPL
jgi:hypothetical protein